MNAIENIKNELGVYKDRLLDINDEIEMAMVEDIKG